MATLTETIRQDLTDAMKARDALKTSTLRLLQAALKNEQIEKMHELSDEEATAVIRKQGKQRQDSIEQYTKGNRADLADKETAELAILEAYLPKQLGEDDLRAIVTDTIAKTGATSKKDAGRVIKEIMSAHKGLVDGRKVQELVQEALP